MIISTVLNLPKIVPDDWDKWWDIWNKNSQKFVRVRKTHNIAGCHEGFDVFIPSLFLPTYTAPYVDLKLMYPSLFEQIMVLPTNIIAVRFIKSYDDFTPHMDNLIPNWTIRNMFYCQDPEPQWYYLSAGEKDKTKAKWLTLPEQSNWWAYHDGNVQHATVHRPQYPKILIQYFTRPFAVKSYVESQFNEFPEHNISFD